MPSTKAVHRAEQELLGKAIRTLREQARLPQSHIAKALDITTQGWGPYEAGERGFTDEKLERVLESLGASEDDLERVRAELLGQAKPAGVAERSAPFLLDVVGRSQGPHDNDATIAVRRVDLRQILGPSSGAIEVATEEMAPWAEPGEILFFDRDRYPKRGLGCVVETRDGRFLPRLYERSDGSTLFVKVLNPPRIDSLALADIKGVYAVRLRGD